MVFSYEEIPASLARPKLRLFLDTASPFSYFAAVVILRYKDDPKSPWKGKVDMEFIPSDLVEIRKRADNFPGPPAIRKKARYLAQDMHRNRRTYRLDLIPNPAAFPAKTGENLLLLAHVKINYPESVLQEAVMNLFEAYWTHNKDPALDVVMEETVGKAIGGSDKVREILASIRKDGREEKKWLERCVHALHGICDPSLNQQLLPQMDNGSSQCPLVRCPLAPRFPHRQRQNRNAGLLRLGQIRPHRRFLRPSLEWLRAFTRNHANASRDGLASQTQSQALKRHELNSSRNMYTLHNSFVIACLGETG